MTAQRALEPSPEPEADEVRSLLGERPLEPVSGDDVPMDPGAKSGAQSGTETEGRSAIEPPAHLPAPLPPVSAPVPQPVQRATRRPGLGAPIPAVPVQRETPGSPVTAPTPSRAGRIGEPLSEMPVPVPVPVPAPPAPPQEDRVTPPTAVVVPDPSAAPPAEDPRPQAVVRALPVQRATVLVPEPGPEPVAGLVGERGLELRSAPTPEAPEPAERPGSPSAPDPTEPVVVPVSWVPPPTPSPATAPAPPSATPPSPAPTPLQRTVTTDPPAPSVPPGFAAVLQPYDAPLRPGPPPGELRRPEAVQRLLDAVPSSSAPQPPQSRPLAPALQRAPEHPAIEHPATEPPPQPAVRTWPTIQREPAPEPAPAAEPAPAPVPAPAPPAQAPPAAAPPGTAPPPAAPKESTDELVRRLIGPLSRLLRAELRLDRERAGVRLDPRH
ncbi:hypothetical protein AB0C77_10075 [Streptomyces sp. NPDC048629]|uniref:hypothetical protein n=1 Tax=Streptomyces sp. NPDC048629 TaxID=3154824 RepID=UPI00342619BB